MVVARRYDFIEGLVEAWDGPTSLRLVPSYAFSAALAAYYAGKHATAEQGTATGVHDAGARPELDVQLVNAIVTFPLAVEHLVKAMQDKVCPARAQSATGACRCPVGALADAVLQCHGCLGTCGQTSALLGALWDVSQRHR